MLGISLVVGVLRLRQYNACHKVCISGRLSRFVSRLLRICLVTRARKPEPGSESLQVKVRKQKFGSQRPKTISRKTLSASHYKERVNYTVLIHVPSVEEEIQEAIFITSSRWDNLEHLALTNRSRSG